MRDIDWIIKDNEAAIATHKERKELMKRLVEECNDHGPIARSQAEVVVHARQEKQAETMFSGWRYLTIDYHGEVKNYPVKSQVELFRAFPEISPTFFENFSVSELTIRQGNGTKLIIQRIR